MVGRDDLARLRGTPAHAEALAAMQRALGLRVDTPAPPPPIRTPEPVEAAELPEPIPFPGVYHGPDPEPVVEEAVDADVAAAAAIGELLAQPAKEADPAEFLRLYKAAGQRAPLAREVLAELEAEWKRGAAAAAGVPFLTCLRYPSPAMQREHHAHWRLVYWLDAGETRAAWRCLKCYPELERILVARVVEERTVEHAQA